MPSSFAKVLGVRGDTGDAGDFLDLSVEERRFVDVKLALADGLRRRREALGLTQGQVAARLGSSQSRVAKMEAAHRSVTTDLLLKALFRLEPILKM